MASKTLFSIGEFYHVYNRGVDKRTIFSGEDDLDRFLQSMREFNTLEPIGSIYEKTFADKRFGGRTSKPEKLVNFICYCLNPNHYHFVLEQVVDKGIEKFMQRLGTGYTRYFNDKYKRTGALFQGGYKAVHIDSNEQLLHVGSYVNLNDMVHQLGGSTSKLVESRSSWGEYVNEGCSGSLCKKDMILEQFSSKEEYRVFAQDALSIMLERKQREKELKDLLFE